MWEIHGTSKLMGENAQTKKDVPPHKPPIISIKANSYGRNLQNDLRSLMT